MRSRVLHISLLLILVCVSALSCVRQSLEDPEYLLASIPISIDWSESNVPEESIENVSLYFYPRTGEDPVLLISSNIYYAVAELPIGVYDVLVFNEIKDNISGMKFNNEKEVHNYSISAVDKSAQAKLTMLYNLQDGEYVTDYPDAVGSIGLDEPIEVTAEMIDFTRGSEYTRYLETLQQLAKDPETLYSKLELYSRSSNGLSSDETLVLDRLSLLTPQPTTTTCHITLKVINLSNAQWIEAIVHGFTDEVTLFNRETKVVSEDATPIHLFNFAASSATYFAGSETDGTVEHTLLNFGRHPDENTTYTILFKAVLNDGSSITVTHDVTNQVTLNDEPVIEIDLTADEYTLELPEGTYPGYFGVTEWGDAVDVPIK